MPEPAAAHPQQQHRQVLAVGAKLAVALDDLHLPAVHQAGSAGRHPDFADHLRDLGAAFHRRQDLGVETVDLDAQGVDVGFRVDGHSYFLEWGILPGRTLLCHLVEAPDKKPTCTSEVCHSDRRVRKITVAERR